MHGQTNARMRMIYRDRTLSEREIDTHGQPYLDATSILLSIQRSTHNWTTLEHWSGLTADLLDSFASAGGNPRTLETKSIPATAQYLGNFFDTYPAQPLTIRSILMFAFSTCSTNTAPITYTVPLLSITAQPWSTPESRKQQKPSGVLC